MKLLSLLKSIIGPSHDPIERVKKIIHLAPCNGIGGVESAVRSMEKVKHDKIDFKVDYIVKVVDNPYPWQKWVAFLSPIPLLRAVRRVILNDTDVLIVSLWRSVIVGILVKCLRPKIKLVVFIHSATDVHWLDLIVTRLAMGFAWEIWADSDASLREIAPEAAKS